MLVIFILSYFIHALIFCPTAGPVFSLKCSSSHVQCVLRLDDCESHHLCTEHLSVMRRRMIAHSYWVSYLMWSISSYLFLSSSLSSFCWPFFSYSWTFICPSSGLLLCLFIFCFAISLHLHWKDRLWSDKSKVKRCGRAVLRVTGEASLSIIPTGTSVFNNIAIRTCSQLSLFCLLPQLKYIFLNS